MLANVSDGVKCTVLRLSQKTLKFFCGAFFTKKATEVKGEKPLSLSAESEIPFFLQKTQEW